MRGRSACARQRRAAGVIVSMGCAAPFTRAPASRQSVIRLMSRVASRGQGAQLLERASVSVSPLSPGPMRVRLPGPDRGSADTEGVGEFRGGNAGRFAAHHSEPIDRRLSSGRAHQSRVACVTVAEARSPRSRTGTAEIRGPHRRPHGVLIGDIPEHARARRSASRTACKAGQPRMSTGFAVLPACAASRRIRDSYPQAVREFLRVVILSDPQAALSGPPCPG